MNEEGHYVYCSSFWLCQPSAFVDAVVQACERSEIKILKAGSDERRLKPVAGPSLVSSLVDGFDDKVSSVWYFLRTNAAKEPIAIHVSSEAQVLAGRAIQTVYWCPATLGKLDIVRVMTNLAEAVRAAHGFTDSLFKLNRRLHQVDGMGRVEKNSSSILRMLPGLFHGNYFGPVYRKHLIFERVPAASPISAIAKTREGIVLTSLNMDANYSIEEKAVITALGEDYFHLQGQFRATYKAPALQEFLESASQRPQ